MEKPASQILILRYADAFTTIKVVTAAAAATADSIGEFILNFNSFIINLIVF